MATLVLTAVGTAVGGPIGGAIGGLIGRQVDGEVFGGGSREGPRLRDLSVTTSTYGQPIPRIFGRMRVPGTIIWSTDLVEASDTQGGGKGKPSTTTYSYSVSFAVALSSVPIARVGRIWADGNLLRGQAGDLKVEGTMRTYIGDGAARIDPLIAADRGAQAPAFRDCAYVVFEDLQLGDFGNRIPALTFEIFERDQGDIALAAITPMASADINETLEFAKGFSDEGGPLVSSLSSLAQVYPLDCSIGKDGIAITTQNAGAGTPKLLSARLFRSEELGRYRQRDALPDREALALRYYDEARDYQPSRQAANGRRISGRERSIDLPAAMTSTGAKHLINMRADRARHQQERMEWTVGSFDPDIRVGSLVIVSDIAGVWSVRNWEWSEHGFTYSLTRAAGASRSSSVLPSDAGAGYSPRDLPIPRTELVAFELPGDGSLDPDRPLLFAAASAENSAWNGAALFVEQGSSLISLGNANVRRAIQGSLVEDLPPGNSVLLERSSAMTVELVAPDLGFQDTDLTGMANGLNRLCVGGEIVQFLGAKQLDQTIWRLTGLLRGRAGTEHLASTGHAAGASVIKIDDRLTVLDPDLVSAPATDRIAAIGRGDDQPVFATIDHAGSSRRPLAPVHPRQTSLDNGDRTFCWTRRARGQWKWDSLFDVPLVEAEERYLIGFGPVIAPLQSWSSAQPTFTLTATSNADLVANFGTGALWVAQIGTYARSEPLMLATLS